MNVQKNSKSNIKSYFNEMIKFIKFEILLVLLIVEGKWKKEVASSKLEELLLI